MGLNGRMSAVKRCLKTFRLLAGQSNRRSLDRATLPFLAVLAALLGMAGCSSSNPGPVVTPELSVALLQTPPDSLTVGGTAAVSAAVSNDPANSGVDWVAICDSATSTSGCGSFSPKHTANGESSTFTAPVAVPANNKVTISALSATDHSKASTAPLTVLSTVTSITITQAPPESVPAGVLLTLAAKVTGDPANLGVDWKATCTTLTTTVNCTYPGFNPPAHSAAGGGTTQFTVPIPDPVRLPDIIGGTVTLTAYAAADHNFHAVASFIVTVPVSISLTQTPPSSMQTNATANVAAVVTNDTTSAGVDWQVTCQSGPCGAVTPSHTASGQVATFTAPASPPNGGPPDPTVTITAYATATGLSGQVNATTKVTIVAPITVAITQGVPGNSTAVNGTAPLVATVTGDAANAGLDWTVSCGTAGACGTFSATHTASGATTTYTAPGSMPAGGTVTIKAASTTAPAQSATQTVTITASSPNNLLSGQFVLLLTATNSSKGPYALGGVITGDGNGNITKGIVDVADGAGDAAASIRINSPSTYSIGPDRRGQIQLLIDTNALTSGFGVPGAVPAQGAITLSVVFSTPNHALVSESDTFGNAIGTLDLQNAADLAAFQNSTAGLNGTYSLALSGVEAASPFPGYYVASAVTIRSSAENSYVADQSDNSVIKSVPFTVTSKSLNTAVDANGEMVPGTVNLGLPTQFNLDAWMIDANHFAITDWRDSFAGTPSFIAAGYLTAQPTSPAVSGTYAFTEAGATSAGKPQVAGGVLKCSSTGVLDVTPLGGPVLSNASITATCSAPANGRSLITISGVATAGIKNFAAYPTLDNKLYLIELDGSSSVPPGPSGAGVAIKETVPAPVLASSFSGKYAYNFRAATAIGSENFAAQIISDGISVLSGTADVNSFTATPPAATPSVNAVLSGSFTTDPTTGRFLIPTLTIAPAAGQPPPQVTTLHAACYIVDASSCLLLGLDATAPGAGILQLQPGL